MFANMQSVKKKRENNIVLNNFYQPILQMQRKVNNCVVDYDSKKRIILEH